MIITAHQDVARTLTQRIFEVSAPYDNIYQTSAKRILFVCSAGMLRSPTCANAGTTLGFNTRACGSHGYALIPLSANLIEWAHKIVFVNEENFHEAIDNFASVGYDEDIKRKAVVWDIEDNFDWGDDVLFRQATQLIKEIQF